MGCGFRAPQQHTARWIQESELAIRPKAPSSSPPRHKHTQARTHAHAHIQTGTNREIFRQAQPIDSSIYSIKRSITQPTEYWRSEWGNTIIAIQSKYFRMVRVKQYELVTSKLKSLRKNTDGPPWHRYFLFCQCAKTTVRTLYPSKITLQGRALSHSVPHNPNSWYSVI